MPVLKALSKSSPQLTARQREKMEVVPGLLVQVKIPALSLQKAQGQGRGILWS